MIRIFIDKHIVWNSTGHLGLYACKTAGA